MLFSKLKSVLPLPKLHAPIIEVNGSELSVTNPVNNGDFVEQWELYTEGNGVPLVKKEIGETAVNLDDIPAHLVGTNLFAKLYATDFLRSDISNIVQYFKQLPLSEARAELAGASTENYAVFAGGRATSYSVVVDAFNDNLVRFNPTALSEARTALSGVSVGDYALFAGGFTSLGYSSKVDAYSDELIRVTAADLTEGRCECAIATINNLCFVFGGLNGSTAGESLICDVYDADLIKCSSIEMEHSHAYGAAAACDWYVAVAGGLDNSTGTTIASVEMIDSTGTYLFADELFTPRAFHRAETIGSVNMGNASAGFFAGINSDGTANNVEYYDSGLSHYVLNTTFDSPMSDYASVRVNNDVLIAGGQSDQTLSAVTRITERLTMQTLPDLTYGRHKHAGCTVGGKVLFAGGQGSSRFDSIEVYDTNFQHSVIT